MDIVEALDADEGMTCAVGAGGKKSTLYALAERAERAVVTATVRIPIFDRQVAEVVVTEDPVAALEVADPGDFPLGLVPERERADRYRGYEPAVVDDIAAAHDGPTLVKADGARTRELKAPGDDEPRIPGGADTVLPIASVQAVGRQLDEEYVHRVERVAELTGLEPGEEIGAADVATVLAHEDGGLKGVGDATAIPVVNKVDGVQRIATGREIAVGIHSRADVPRVVLAKMIADEPLVKTF